MEAAIKARRLIVRSFAAVILVGAVLLALPITSRGGGFTNFVDALFTSYFSSMRYRVNSKGHMGLLELCRSVIIMLLIQFGGLSYLTITTFTLLLLTGARIGLRTRITLASQWNVNSLQGVVKLLGFTVRFALLVELIGALLLSITFIPYYLNSRGLAGGIWASVFDAVSASTMPGLIYTAVLSRSVNLLKTPS